MTMKLEVSDNQSNHSDYSCDSQSSQESAGDHGSTVPSSRTSLSLALASLEGLNSGVPTRTTATITPTQLRSFEQTYIDLNNYRSEQTNHVGFVPPSISHAQANSYSIIKPAAVDWSDMGPTTLQVSPGPLSCSGDGDADGDGDSSSSPGLPTTTVSRRRNMGGRRPAKQPYDLTPEEAERRQIRRERNKMAAARCRQRRVEQTNKLQKETEALEAKKQALNDEIRKYQADSEHLQALLNNHRLICRLGKRSASPPDVKPFQMQNPYAYTEDGVRVKVEAADPTADAIDIDPVLGLDNNIFITPNSESRIITFNPGVVTSSSGGGCLQTPEAGARPRPTFLQVPVSVSPAERHNNKAHQKIVGVEISTPSTGIPFNFESLMEGGTGLTPVHPHPCGALLQRAGAALAPAATDLVVSPDTINNSSLVSL